MAVRSIMRKRRDSYQRGISLARKSSYVSARSHTLPLIKLIGTDTIHYEWYVANPTTADRWARFQLINELGNSIYKHSVVKIPAGTTNFLMAATYAIPITRKPGTNLVWSLKILEGPTSDPTTDVTAGGHNFQITVLTAIELQSDVAGPTFT